MLTLQKIFKYDGPVKDAIFTALKLQFSYPVFSYDVADPNGGLILRDSTGRNAITVSQELGDGTYRVDLPVKDVAGDSTSNFINYMQQALDNQNFDIEDLAMDVDVLYSDAVSGTSVGGNTFGCLYFLKTGSATVIRGAALTNGISSTAPAPSSLPASSLVLVNRAHYDALFAEFCKQTNAQDEYIFVSLLRQLINMADDHSHQLHPQDAAVLARLTAMLSERGLANAKNALALMQGKFAQLFEFNLTVKEIKKLEVSGVFNVKAKDGVVVTQDDINLYDIAAEYSMLSVDDAVGFSSTHVNWATNPNLLKDNQIAFAFDDSQPIIANAVHGLLAITVRAFDGSVAWTKTFKPDDPTLQKLQITVSLQRPGALSDADKKKAAVNKKLRGKIIAINTTAALKDATVLVQAKAAGDQAWRIVSAGSSDSFGNFVLPYPLGNYVAAQAVVSLAPNSPADIPVNPEEPDESIADDFLYLLVKDVDAPEEETTDGDCGCDSPVKVARLPDHNDLINSDQYSQDIGGSCINLSTPNRTLREFNYQAIVRTSDPDVANYTLRKKDDGSFELNGGAAKIQRAAIDLSNPIKWQDAPDFHSNLSIYQAVTVATGHILHYKSEFKADGYSLGDLLYSLPLAPGQKKQIVVFDSSHSLRGAESQSLSQGERLAANLGDEREITDQIGGGISEALQGSSDASTSGVSAGLGAAGSAGFFGASLGVAGGYANANSSASQNSSRNVSQYFGEKLRQSIMQNASSYRQQNASVVTTVQEGQHYAAETEVVANHNHCHALTMMYFEVLRHYAIFQELTNVEECVFVPLLMTHFTADNICKWRDVLAKHLLPMHGNTYLQPRRSLRMGRAHPLLGAFDANDRIRTNYANVDFPTTTYDDEVISYIKGEMTMRVNLPRPKTRYDRIKSLPIISKTVTHEESDAASVAKSVALGIATGGLSLLFGDDGTKTVSEQVLARAKVFDAFMQLDANYQTVPPAKCIRVVNFRQIQMTIWGTNLVFSGADFFDEGNLDKKAWSAYATILGYADVLDMMEYYFQGRLIAEWDDIFYNDIVPVVFQKIVDNLHLDFINADWTNAARYKGGERLMTISMNGSTSLKRNQFQPKLRLSCSNSAIKTIADQVTLVVQKVRLTYSTPHYNGVLFAGSVGDDLLDDTFLFAPENSDEKRNPRKEDIYIVQKLIEHLNSNIEHYNKALWFNLDHDRRFALLDGFNIQIFNDFGQPNGYRSLASVVKNNLISIAGNSLVFPVAAGYKISKSYIVEQDEDGVAEDVSLLDHYRPETPVPPYRVSVPSRGVFLEAVKSQCNACEPEEDNTSQDWTKFTTDEPTSFVPVNPPTPSITDWKAAFKDFASPIVNIQNAPAMPTPGAGLAGLDDLLGKAGIFKDITGLDANQQNAIKTLVSNNENVRALADTAKGLTMQDHNTTNSDKIMSNLKKAKDSGGISQTDYSDLMKNHLQQVIDGGANQKLQTEQSKQSLTDAAINAAGQGKNVTAQRVTPEGGAESIVIEGGSPENVLAQVDGIIPMLKQENAMACWATVATMMVNWKRAQSMPVADVLATAGAVYVQKFNNKQGLSASEKPAFLAALGMAGEPPASYQLQQYIDWMKTFGPLWVTTDSAKADGPFAPHARILFKISGTGTPDGVGTNFTFINPATGGTETESFAQFLKAYEQMVTDNPSDNLFVQIVHFSSTVNAGGGGEGNSGGPSEGSGIDTDARRIQPTVATQLAAFNAGMTGNTSKMVAGYLKAKMEQVWNGNGGIVCIADYKDTAKQVEYLDSNVVPSGFASVATTAKSIITEAFAEWDTISAGKPDPLTWADPGTWAYAKSFVDGGKRYGVLRTFPLVKPGYAIDYYPVLAHETCHYLLSFSEDAVLADTRAYLFDPSITAAADLTLGAKARNALIQEVVGRRLNYLAHKEIDLPLTPEISTGANIGKAVYEWAKGNFAAGTYYGPITEFLNKLGSDALRRNQVGIWLQNFYTSVDMFDDAAFTNKLKSDLNLAGEFLKKATQTEYDAETALGIH